MGYGYDETYAVYNEQKTKARKPHTCSACEETIQPSHTYWRVSILFHGDWRSLKRCERCQAVHNHLKEILSYRDEWPEEDLNCGMDYEDEHGPMPTEVAELAFVTQEQMQDRANV